MEGSAGTGSAVTVCPLGRGVARHVVGRHVFTTACGRRRRSKHLEARHLYTGERYQSHWLRLRRLKPPADTPRVAQSALQLPQPVRLRRAPVVRLHGGYRGVTTRDEWAEPSDSPIEWRAAAPPSTIGPPPVRLSGCQRPPLRLAQEGARGRTTREFRAAEPSNGLSDITCDGLVPSAAIAQW